MRSRLGVLVGIGCLALAGSAAHAEGGMYATGQAGAVFVSDADNTQLPFSVESSFDTGFDLSASLGYRWDNGFRLEGEVGYAESDFDNLTITNDGGVGVALGVGSLNGLSLDSDGDVSVVRFMANGFFDFDTGSGWTPYIGGGVGIANVSFNDVAVLGVTIVDDDDTVFAYQVGAGLRFELAQSVDLSLDYRYFATEDPEFDDVTGFPFESELDSHIVRLGVLITF